MYKDPIVEEIHLIRESLCKKFDFDIQEIFLDVKQREQQHRDRVVRLIRKKDRSIKK